MNHDNEDLAHIKGFCTTIEQILAAYGEMSKEMILEIQRPIIGDISLQRKKTTIDYDILTILGKRKNNLSKRFITCYGQQTSVKDLQIDTLK